MWSCILRTALLTMLLVYPAWAEVRITRSNSPSYPFGKTYSDTHEFSLSKDEDIEIIKSPGGKTFKLKGPFKGTLESYVNACPDYQYFFGLCSRGTNGDEPAVTGGSRGVSPKED